MGNTFSLDHSYRRGGREINPLKTVETPSDSSFQMTEGRGQPLDEQRPVSTWKLCVTYKTAIFSSLFISISSLTWGYEVLLGRALTSIPGFLQDYGHLSNGLYIISWKWQVLFNIAPFLGGIIGSLAAGYSVSTYGTRNSLAVACIISTGAISLQIFSEDSATLFTGKVVHGGSLGAFITISPTYATEIVPASLRSLTTSSVVLMIGIGHLFANIILKLFSHGTLETAYKIPLAIQIIFPVVLLCGIRFCPESPWFLLRSGEVQKCYDTLRRLGYPNPQATIEGMEVTIDAELGQSGSKGYLDCFKKEDLKRTEIAVGAVIAAGLVGVVFVLGYSNYFFDLAFHVGASTHSSGMEDASASALSLLIGVFGLSLVGVMSSWFLINNINIGRRGLMLYGTMALMVLLAFIGILDVIPSSSKALIYVQCVCVTLHVLIFFFTVGSSTWVLLAEIGSTTLRSRTCALAIVTQSLFSILMHIVMPLMINPNEANMGGKIGFIFAGTSVLSLIWTYFRVPETSNRDAAEMDILFRQKVPARKFKSYQFYNTEA